MSSLYQAPLLPRCLQPPAIPGGLGVTEAVLPVVQEVRAHVSDLRCGRAGRPFAF